MRARLASRFGFLMLAAGCAVGLGNVWRFPFVVGQNGGAAFVIVYLAFLLILGFPLLVAELSIGRGAKSGISSALPMLARRGKGFWRIAARIIFAGNFVLMIYYADVAGWLVKYACDYLGGGIGLPDGGTFADHFTAVTHNGASCTLYMFYVVAAATLVCLAGVVKGVERVTKFLMVSLLALLGILATKALSLPGAMEGVRFYLYPDWGKFMAHPWRGIMEAMGQAFFTLSLGIGCMTIFGSYVGRRHSLVKEAAWIIAIDTIVALLAGLVIFPACLSYGVEPSSGPGLIFIALPEVCSRMAGGAFWGFCFFLFLAFAAITTIIAVFECMIGGLCDEAQNVKWPQKTVRRVFTVVVGLDVAIASLPCRTTAALRAIRTGSSTRFKRAGSRSRRVKGPIRCRSTIFRRSMQKRKGSLFPHCLTPVLLDYGGKTCYTVTHGNAEENDICKRRRHPCRSGTDLQGHRRAVSDLRCAHCRRTGDVLL